MKNKNKDNANAIILLSVMLAALMFTPVIIALSTSNVVAKEQTVPDDYKSVYASNPRAVSSYKCDTFDTLCNNTRALLHTFEKSEEYTLFSNNKQYGKYKVYASGSCRTVQLYFLLMIADISLSPIEY